MSKKLTPAQKAVRTRKQRARVRHLAAIKAHKTRKANAA